MEYEKRGHLRLGRRDTWPHRIPGFYAVFVGGAVMFNRDVMHETHYRVTRYGLSGDILFRRWFDDYQSAQNECQHQVNESEHLERVALSVVTSVHLFDEVQT